MHQKFVRFIPIKGKFSPAPLLYATSLSSGIDLPAFLPNGPKDIMPGEIGIIPIGYTCKIDPNYEGQIRSRSGLAAKHGVFVINSPGTIDADFEGDIKIILMNLGNHKFEIKHGDRIAQFVISPIVRDFEYMPEEFKHRSTGGLGSTGV